MSNEIAIHSDARDGYSTTRAEVNDHPGLGSNSFTHVGMRLDSMRVSIYLHPSDLLDLAGALERTAEELREIAERYETRRRAEAFDRLRSSLLEDVTA